MRCDNALRGDSRRCESTICTVSKSAFGFPCLCSSETAGKALESKVMIHGEVFGLSKAFKLRDCVGGACHGLELP